MIATLVLLAALASPPPYICPYQELAAYDESAASAYQDGDVPRTIGILESEIGGWSACIAHESDNLERINLRLIVAITQFQQAVVSARSSDKPKAEEYGLRALRGARALLAYHAILDENPAMLEKITRVMQRMVDSAKAEGFSLAGDA